MYRFIIAFLLLPFFALGAPVSWDRTSNLLQPLRSSWSDEVRVPYITATSTSATSTLKNTSITGGVNIGGSYFTNLLSFLTSVCSTITGSADLCDGNDAGGGGSPGGSDTQVQFNDGGSFGGDDSFVYSKDNNIISLGDVAGVGGGIQGKNATSGNDNGVSLAFASGNGFGSGTGGTMEFGSGGGGDTGDGGVVVLNGGQGGATSGSGGSIVLSAGSAEAGNGNGGDISLIPGGHFGAGLDGLVRVFDKDSNEIVTFATGTAGTTTIDSNVNILSRLSVLGLASTSRLSVINGFFQDGLTDCSDEANTVSYTLATGKFGCLADATGGGGGLPGNLYTSSIGSFGVGSSTPWATLSAVGTSTNPLFALSTSTTAYPFFWAQNPNSSSTVPYSGAAVSQIGINFPINGTTTLRDNTYIGGRTVNKHFSAECHTLASAILNSVTADTNNICGGWMFDVGADMTLSAVGAPAYAPTTGDIVPYVNMNGASPVNGESGALRLNTTFFTSTGSPVMEAVVSLGSSTSSAHYYIIGMTSHAFAVATYAARPNHGCWFEASSTVNNFWHAYCRAGGNVSGGTTDVGTSTNIFPYTGLTLSAPYKMRIEMTPGLAIFLINDRVVKVISTSVPSAFLSPMVAVGTTGSTPARSFVVLSLRAWLTGAYLKTNQ